MSGLIALLAAIAVPNLIRTRAAAARSTCINNLRQIDSAMQQWALELHKPSNSPVDYSDIGPYLRNAVACPSGGTSLADSYIIANMTTEPSCRVSPLDHFIPQLGVDRVTLPNGNDGTGVANNNGTNGNPPTTPGRPGPPRRHPPQNNPPGQGGTNGTPHP